MRKTIFQRGRGTANGFTFRLTGAESGKSGKYPPPVVRQCKLQRTVDFLLESLQTAGLCITPMTTVFFGRCRWVEANLFAPSIRLVDGAFWTTEYTFSMIVKD